MPEENADAECGANGDAAGRARGGDEVVGIKGGQGDLY